MQIDLRIAIWNANGLSKHRQELEIFLNYHKIDILLISETHFTSKTFFRIKGYNLICSNHPADTARGGSAILIKTSIQFEFVDKIETYYLQSIYIKVLCNNSPVVFGSVYFPPRYNLKHQDFNDFFHKLGTTFLVGGDFNSKHSWWGSRRTNAKGKELFKCIENNNFSILSTGNPTYWPTDTRKLPDLIDFAVYNGIPPHHLDIQDCFDLSSDHSPLIISYSTQIRECLKNQIFTNKSDINSYVYWLENNININVSLKSGDEIDSAIANFSDLIIEAACLSTPTTTKVNINQMLISSEIREKVRRKRRLRKIWQRSRNPNDRRDFNRANKELQRALKVYKNKSIGEFLENLSPSANDDYSLWKATKFLKRPQKRFSPIKDSAGDWCKTDNQKCIAFAEHLKETFKPFEFNSSSTYTNTIYEFLEATCPMDLPIKFSTPAEILREINELSSSKTPGFDRINAKMVKFLPKKCLVYLTYIFNAILRLSHFPSQWKCAEIVMIPKPKKPENEVKSYRPISLLVTFSKLFERILMRRMLPLIEEYNIIPDFQFGFRHKHGTPEQCHRIVNYVTDTLENKKYCSAVFLDIQQAFDKVWHPGLLYKIKCLLPTPYFLLLKSYLSKRSFYVKYNNAFSNIFDICSGVPQGSVLGPILYTIFTADMPIIEDVLVATYADDTAVLSSNVCANVASANVQNQLLRLENWFIKWNIKVNSTKSNHMTFTLNEHNCPPVTIDGNTIPSSNCVKYLGIYMDRRLTWANHIKSKRQQLDLKMSRLHWMLKAKSQLSTQNKLRIYKAIIKPIWTYGIHLWGCASNSNIEILQRFQSKTLRNILDAPWFVKNYTIHNDLNMPTIKDEIRHYTQKYLQRLSNHPNTLAICLLDDTNERRRLKRLHVLDLPFRI